MKLCNTSSYIAVFCLTTLASLIFGCKHTNNPLGNPGPLDIPTATYTFTCTPTVTSTPGPVSITCYLNYNGPQTNVNWNLVDPNGNTVNTATQTTGTTALTFTPFFYGTYTVNIPAQNPYSFSSQPITINASGNYSVTFSCSNQIISMNPNTINYSSNLGYQIPATISYASSGNLNVPVSINLSLGNNAFNTSLNTITLTNSSSSGFVITKNSCYTSNTTLNIASYDLSNNMVGSALYIPINKGYSIPVSLLLVSGLSYPVTSNTTPASFIFNYQINDSNLSCSNYSVSIYSQSFPNTSDNFSSSITVSSETPFSLSIPGLMNEVYTYLITPDGVSHTNGLRYLSWTQSTISVLGNPTGLNCENMSTANPAIDIMNCDSLVVGSTTGGNPLINASY